MKIYGFSPTTKLQIENVLRFFPNTTKIKVHLEGQKNQTVMDKIYLNIYKILMVKIYNYDIYIRKK